MTRAVGLLAYGHPVEATRLNLGVWVLALLLACPRLPAVGLERIREALLRASYQRTTASRKA